MFSVMYGNYRLVFQGHFKRCDPKLIHSNLNPKFKPLVKTKKSFLKIAKATDLQAIQKYVM